MKNLPFCLFSLPEEGKRVVWEITSQCNMFCKHCCSKALPDNYPQREFISCNEKLIEKRIDEMISFGIKEFYISGGDPFFVKSIFALLNYLKTNGAKVNIATNGFLLDKKYIKKLSNLKINNLHLSLDSYSEKDHNFLRDGDFFRKTVANVKKIIDNNIPLRIGCIIWNRNEDNLERMVKFCKNLSVRELRFSWLIKVGRFYNNPQITPQRKWTEVAEEIKELNKKYRNKIKITAHRVLSQECNSHLCPGGDKIFFIDSQGRVSPCSWVSKRSPCFVTKETLKNTTFQDLVESPEVKDFKMMIKERDKKGFKGCPFMAKQKNKSYYSDDNLNY